MCMYVCSALQIAVGEINMAQICLHGGGARTCRDVHGPQRRSAQDGEPPCSMLWPVARWLSWARGV